MTADKIYALPLDRVGDFTFDDTVAEVFSDMIARSVPGYGSVLTMTAELAHQFGSAQSSVYDLGCSLGAATLLMQSRLPRTTAILAVDSSPAMIDRLNQKVVNSPDIATVHTMQSDIRDCEIRQASFVVLNYTLQFLPADQRLALLRRIYEGMLPGGALVLSEKVCFDDPTQQRVLTELHHAFKRAHGYSELEIAQKRAALENTLVPETTDVHCQRLQDAGFDSVCCWFQCINFVSFLAIKR